MSNNSKLDTMIQEIFGHYAVTNTQVNRVYRLYADECEVPIIRMDHALFQAATSSLDDT